MLLQPNPLTEPSALKTDDPSEIWKPSVLS